ncbi:MAG: SAM-dependent methyltransferase [Pseudomonadota bacterium]
MQRISRQPESNQPHLHTRLADKVQRHLRAPGRKPLAAHSVAAFNQLLSALEDQSRALILDSFCGTGHSTSALARQFPEHLIVGVDKSEQRLAKRPSDWPTNALLLRTDCYALWQLLVEHDLEVERHYLLYPNPWPKARQLQRRVHGHPAFYWLTKIPGTVELRSNWQIYVEEFGMAMFLAGRPGSVRQFIPGTPISLFEQKYLSSGHELWQFSDMPADPSAVAAASAPNAA